ncbi:MAG: SDR family NAD(P)-dependent oxidoreductase, partial [Myxococcota bacterium]
VALLDPDADEIDGVIDLSLADPSPIDAPSIAARLARLSALAARRPARLHLVVPAGDGAAAVGSGAWTGWARVAMSEVAGCAVARIAVTDPGAVAVTDGVVGADDAVAWVVADWPAGSEVTAGSGGGSRSRLERIGPVEAPADATLDGPGRTDVRAVVTAPGQLSSVAWVRSLAPEPGPDEVLLDVEAVGLNFKDVVVAAGLLPDKAWTHGLTGAELGLDVAGVVRAAGANAPFAVGDPVLGLARHCLGSFVVADRRLVVRRPDALSPTAAAALPTVGLTAWVALVELARVRPGETVLVHSGSGGVGRVAVALAASLGATVLASAGSDERRDQLRQLGVAAVVDSRSPRFREEVLAATDGRGVDVVLNSLAGPLLVQGLRCLAPFGRFIEIGKADLYEDRPIGLETFGENRALFGLDINRWANLRREETGRLLAEVVARVVDRTLPVPPIRAVPFDRAAEALGVLAHARHAGKVVVTRSATVPTVHPPRLAVRGTVVVTGGGSGFGLAIAQWLAERGAETVVLVGRSGEVRDPSVVDAIRARGTAVEIAAVDVTDPAAVDATIARHRGSLTGVVHAAMVLDDAPLAAHDQARFERVLAPKVDGAWNLHRATRDLDLSMFVVISSIAAAVGTPGQAAYAAANGFLDAFAAHRRSLGLPATAVAFGPLADVGVVARASAADQRKILAHGVGSLRVGEALALLEGALIEQATTRIAADVDWARVTARLGARFAHLADAVDAPVAGSERARLAGMAPGPRAEAVAAGLSGLVARLVGADAVDIDVPLSRIGLDSLVATELASRIHAELGVGVPLVRILRGPTVRELADEVAPQIGQVGHPGRVGREAGSDGPHRWIRRSVGDAVPGRAERGGEVRARLFCFLPLGGDPSAYEAWQDEVPAGLEVCTVELPADVAAVDGLRDRLVAELAPLCTVPFGLYGHSVGGWVALEVAPALAATGAEPRFVALGAVPTPELLRSILPPTPAGPSAIDDDQVLDALRTLRVPARVLDAPDTRARLLAATRRDLWLGASSWDGGARSTYDGDVIVIRGATDPLDTLGAPQIEALGLRCVAWVELPAGHLFHQDPSVRGQLAALVARPFAAEVGR